jgi:hypothetical protein
LEPSGVFLTGAPATAPPSIEKETTMEQLQALKQMLQMNRMAFDNSFNMMMSAFEQNKLMFNTYLTQSAGLPAEGKKAVEDWMKSYKKGCEEFKRMIDASYDAADDQLSKMDA